MGGKYYIVRPYGAPITNMNDWCTLDEKNGLLRYGTHVGIFAEFLPNGNLQWSHAHEKGYFWRWIYHENPIATVH